mmetsp:Transcript_53526/g.79923  ORF Transcript_53526/g.79923 Transcript_53526/m.79923 type:complete len:82 (-) Transcript_53526:602-847(-)
MRCTVSRQQASEPRYVDDDRVAKVSCHIVDSVIQRPSKISLPKSKSSFEEGHTGGITDCFCTTDDNQRKQNKNVKEESSVK